MLNILGNRTKLSDFVLFTSIQFIAVYMLFMQNSNLENLENSYKDLEYGETIILADELMQGSEDLNCRDKMKIYFLKGISQYSIHDYEGAEESFKQLLSLNRETKLDSVEVSPKIIDFFERIKKDRIELTISHEAENVKDYSP